MSKIRVRFAPSPTGPQHIGGIRTALYNYIFAKQNKGDFILRIEDTDQSRLVPESESYLKEALNWLNIIPNESPDTGGEYGPYKQSERKEIYSQYIKQLLESGHAYYAFDTPEEIDAMRDRLKLAKIAAPQYNSISRESMKNSLTMPPEIVKQKIDNGDNYVVRIKIPKNKEIRIKDLIRGWVTVNSSTLDDKVLMKSDGMPTYHFANVVDDHLMKISHVIRGEEWLPSTPIHVYLYECFEWKAPEFAHLPLLLKPNGIGKLSKRDADKQGYPVFPIEWVDKKTNEVYSGFRESGYLPEAIINFLVFLGWNPGTQKEIYHLDELIKDFSLKRVSKHGVKFDIQKANWYNQNYLREKSIDDIVKFLKDNIKMKDIKYSDEQLKLICELVRERAVFLKDVVTESNYFF